MTARRGLLCAVLDCEALGSEPRVRGAALFRGGVDWIQLRDRTVESDVLYETSKALVSARNDAAASDRTLRVIVNRRSDIAFAAAADGVHLGFNAASAEEARTLLGQDAWIGASFHSTEEVRAANLDILSYGHLAPIWDPLSKPSTRTALGPTHLAEAAAIGLPLLAQGGVDSARATQAFTAGAHGIAVTGTLAHRDDPEAAAKELRDALDRDAE